MDNNVYLIKKDSILGYGEKGDNLTWYLDIYTNIAKQRFIMDFHVGHLKVEFIPHSKQSITYDEKVKEEYRKCRKLLDSILLPEIPEVVQPSGNMLRN